MCRWALNPKPYTLSCGGCTGVSRSPTLVLAFLMADEGLSLEAALAEVGSQIDTICAMHKKEAGQQVDPCLSRWGWASILS